MKTNFTVVNIHHITDSFTNTADEIALTCSILSKWLMIRDCSDTRGVCTYGTVQSESLSSPGGCSASLRTRRQAKTH